MRNFLSSILFLYSLSLIAQNGQYLSAQLFLRDGSNKTGFVLGQYSLDDPKGVYFKTDPSSKASYFEFDQIQEIRFNETLRYITYCTQNTAQSRCHWLKTLLLGKVSLHQGLADEELFFIEETGVFNAIRKPSFEGALNLLKQKCPGFSPPANAKFYPATLVQLVSDYGRCRYPNDQVQFYYVSPTPARVHLGPKLGMNFGDASMFEFSYYGKGNFQGNPALTAGIAVSVRPGKHWAVASELSYFQRSFRDDSVDVWPILSPNYSSVEIDLHFLEFPIMLQYYFSDKKFDPFIQFGVHAGIPLKRTLKEEMFNATPSELLDQPKIIFPGFGYGFGAGLGFTAELSERVNLQVLGQYTRFSTSLRAQSPLFGSSGSERVTPLHTERLQLAGSLLFKL